MKVSQSCLTLCDPATHTVHGILQARILEWVAFPSSRDIPNPGIEPKSPTLQADSLPAEPQGKPQNTGVGSQSLLQGIFPTQGSNPCLPHCRQILYQLSHKGSPKISEWVAYPFSSSKSERERQIPYDITYMQNLKEGTKETVKQTHRRRDQTCGCQGSAGRGGLGWELGLAGAS